MGVLIDSGTVYFVDAVDMRQKFVACASCNCSCMSGLFQYTCTASTASSGCCFTEQSFTIAGQNFQGHDLKISLNPGVAACDIYSDVEETLFA